MRPFENLIKSIQTVSRHEVEEINNHALFHVFTTGAYLMGHEIFMIDEETAIQNDCGSLFMDLWEGFSERFDDKKVKRAFVNQDDVTFMHGGKFDFENGIPVPIWVIGIDDPNGAGKAFIYRSEVKEAILQF